MKEDFLHYLFKTKQLGRHFQSIQNGNIEILDFGFHNPNSGPDFLNAKVKIDNVLWAGHIEFHIKSSEWYQHKHQFDQAYNNVILHLVYENNKEVQINGRILETVVIKNKIPERSLNTYNYLSKNKSWIPCAKNIKQVDEFTISLQKEKAIFTRLERKSDEILELLKSEKGDERKTYLILMASVLGGKVNALPMIDLIHKTRLSWFAKLNFDHFRIEALLFGIAGLLQEPKDEYHHQLTEEYKYLKEIYNPQEIPKVTWKYSRMRPPNFPENRIAQLAAILSNQNLFSSLLQNPQLNSFDELGLSAYWKNHYQFGNPNAKRKSAFTIELVNLIHINATIPFLFSLGRFKKNQELKDKALILMAKLPAEKNSIVKNWKELGLLSQNSFDSQALIEQKNEWCNKKKCLICEIGNSLLKS